jgi:hypothetical protein
VALTHAADLLRCSVFDLLSRPDAEVWTAWASTAEAAERSARTVTRVEL